MSTDKTSTGTKHRQTKEQNNQKIERSKRLKFSGNFAVAVGIPETKKTNEKKKNCMKSSFAFLQL
jgi:hypothetical protein